MPPTDIVFVGHTYRDRIRHVGHAPVDAPGGAITYGAVAAARIGATVAAVTRLAERDRGLLADLETAGVRVIVLPSDVTPEFEVIYPDATPEHRTIYQRKRAAPFTADEMPPIEAHAMHLAGNADGEFTPEFIRAMRIPGRRLSLDLQGCVRQRGPDGQTIALRDVPGKEALVAGLDVVKADSAEAEILTGERNPLPAARCLASWGCPEVVLTRTNGLVGCFSGRAGFVPFTNRSARGRNGRGDTAVGAYLVGRQTHGPEEALAFAAALVSIKLERPGPFAGSTNDVLARLARSPSWTAV